MWSKGSGRNGQDIMEAFLEEGVGLRSRHNLNILYRNSGEGIPGKGSRMSKSPERATRRMCSGIIGELPLGQCEVCQVTEMGQEK